MTLFCTVCTHAIPEDRADKGGDTCSSICQTQKRKARRKRQKEIQRQRLLASPWFSKLVRESAKELNAEKSAKRSAPQGVHGMESDVQTTQTSANQETAASAAQA